MKTQLLLLSLVTLFFSPNKIIGQFTDRCENAEVAFNLPISPSDSAICLTKKFNFFDEEDDTYGGDHCFSLSSPTAWLKVELSENSKVLECFV